MEKSAGTILVFDDDPDILEMLEEILRGAGYAVETRAERSVRDVVALMPDLVHIDCPPGSKKHVLTFAQRLRLDPKTANIPMIISVSSLRLIEPEALRDQLIHVLVRPFRVGAFLKSVHDLVAAGRASRA